MYKKMYMYVFIVCGEDPPKESRKPACTITASLSKYRTRLPAGGNHSSHIHTFFLIRTSINEKIYTATDK